MFLFTRLDKEAQRFVSSLPSMGNSRGIGVSVAIAKVLSNQAPLPSAKVDDPAAFYNQNAAIEANSKACDLNELMIVDVDKIRELTKQFYCLRYHTLFPKEIIAISEDTPVEDFFGITRELGNEVLESIKKDRVLIMQVQMNVTSILNQIADINKPAV